MPLKHLRVCPDPCAKIRWAPCGIACRVPNDRDPSSWVPNLQDGAGTMQRPGARV